MTGGRRGEKVGGREDKMEGEMERRGEKEESCVRNMINTEGYLYIPTYQSVHMAELVPAKSH